MDSSKFQFFTETIPTWEAMKRCLEDAKSSIEIEHYIMLPDEVGDEFMEILKDRAREGVKIRILLDMVGSYGLWSSKVPDELRDLGIQIKFFNPIKPWLFHRLTTWLFRDHKKLIIVDKKFAFTGGTGLQKEMAPWRDTNAVVEGPAVSEMLESFEEMWAMGDKNIWERIRKMRARQNKRIFITNTPFFKKRFLYYALIDAMASAEKSIYLTTPYFIPDRHVSRVLRLAARRGVEVKIIVPKVLDVPIVGLAARSYYEELLKRKVRIFEYTRTILHAKTGIIDGDWGTFGSFNLDSLSFDYNFEGNIITAENTAIAELRSHFEEDLINSEEIKYSDWRRRPLWEKIKELLVIPIRGFL